VRSTARITCTGSTPNSRSTLTATPVLFAHQAQQQVFCADVVVVEPQRLFLRQRQDAARTLGKAI
jgi:hypothetical protein